MIDILSLLEASGAARCLAFADPDSGLRAFLVLDDLTLGPAAGGVRTLAYPSEAEALRDALRLARAMTVKCALAGLDAGGGKAVVLDHPGLDRPAAFARLGREIEQLGGLFRTAGDLGTTPADLQAMASETGFVHVDERGLAEAAARGLVGCIEACAAAWGADSLAGARVIVQGAGAIGGAAVRALVAAGADVRVADVIAGRAEALAAETGAGTLTADAALTAEADVLCPCASGGVITVEVAARLRVRAVCGAANNLLADEAAAAALQARGILHVPDVIASAGAVIEGIGRSVMGLEDRTPLIDRLGQLAREVLAEARERNTPPDQVALARARRRIADSASSRPPS